MAPRIYVASLSDYNAGRLHGRWIDAAQSAEDIQAEVDEMLAASPEPIAEEWAIHDYDDFHGIELGEYESFEKVAELAQLLDEHGAAYAAYVDMEGAEYATAEGFEEDYCGQWDSEQAYAEEFADDIGLLTEVPDSLSSYFDWEKWTRDLFRGDYYSVDAGLGEGVYVFRRS